MKTNAPKNKKKAPRWLKRIGIGLGILLLAPLILFTIGWANRNLIIDGLQEWYRTNHNGSLEIGRVDANFLSGFPNIGFTINEVRQTDFDTILDKRSSIFVDQAWVSIGAQDLLKGNIQFKSIDIHQAEIYSEIVTKKSVANYIEVKKASQSHPQGGITLPSWLHPEKTEFRLQEVKFISKDSILDKYFNLEAKNFRGSILSDENRSSGKLQFNVLINALGFNTKKGSYINGAMVSGNPEFVLDRKSNTLRMPEFELHIGDENFTTKADFDFTGNTTFEMSFDNEQTHFSTIKKILPDSLSKKLLPYKISDPIETHLNLKGKFRYGAVPFVNGSFSTHNNQLIINDSTQLKNVNFNGYITNDLGKEKASQKKQPGRTDIKVVFEELNAHLKGLEISARESFFQSSDTAKNFFNVHLMMNGPNETLAEVLRNDNFDFKGGNFSFNARILGDIEEPGEVLNHATGNFTLKNSQVMLKSNQLQLPLEIIDLQLNQDKSVLKNLKINLPGGKNLVLTGSLTNVASLLSNDPSNPAQVSLRLDANDLNLDELISTAVEAIPYTKKESSDLKTLHETFKTIYTKFRPEVKLDLNSLEYRGIIFNDVDANMRLSNPETLLFENFSFGYKGSVTHLDGTLRVPAQKDGIKEPIYLYIETESAGPINIFQQLFKISLMNINNGKYAFKGKIIGNIRKLEEVLNNMEGELRLKNAQFYYTNAKSLIDLDSLKVLVNHSDIGIDKFKVDVAGHHPFSLSGKVNNFPGFLLDDVQNNGSIKILMDAAYVDMDEWLETVDDIATKKTENPKKKEKEADLHSVFNDLYQFHPELSLDVDSLKFRGLISHDISGTVHFEDQKVLKLDELHVKYGESQARIIGSVTAQKTANIKNQNPFDFYFSAEMKGKNRDLNDLLNAVNFVFQSGNFEFKASYHGEAKDLKILNSDFEGDLSLGRSIVDIKAADLLVPVDSLHLKIKNNLASLDRLDIDFPGKSAIGITGRINNFSSFINNEQKANSHISFFTVQAPYLNNRDIHRFLESSGIKKDTSAGKTFELKNLKQILNSIYTSYYPSVSVAIDSLIFDKLSVSDFGSDIGYDRKGTFKIEDTQLDYYGGTVRLAVEAGVKTKDNLPIDLQINAEKIPVKQLAKDLDYFGSEELKASDRFEGNLNFILNARGLLTNTGNLDMDSLNGSLEVDLEDLMLYNFKPIMEKTPLMKDERFEHLEFRPIKQTFPIVNGMIIIPRTQVQSSALQVFVEGELKIGEYINLWLALPWSNLKSIQGVELPEKTSFEEAGAKFYLQLLQNKDSDNSRKNKLRTRFRLGNGKMERSLRRN